MELGGAQPRLAGHVDPRHLAGEAGGLDGGVQQVAGERVLAQDLRDLAAEPGRDAEASDLPEGLQEWSRTPLRVVSDRAVAVASLSW